MIETPSFGIKVKLFGDASDDEFDLGVLKGLMFVEGSSSGAFDFVLGHSGDSDLVGVESVPHEEFFDALGASDGEFLFGLDVDGIGLYITFDLEGQIGMAFEHGDIVEEGGVAFGE